MPVSDKSAIINNQYVWKRSSSDVNVVPHNLKLMRIWGAHHNIEVVTSQKPIGYVLKYISKNSDIANVEINQYRKNVRYINQPVAKNDKLRYCVATRVACAPECFHEIEGSWKYHINPKCYTIHLHLPGENYIHFNFGDTQNDIGKKSSLSQLERYFARPNDPSFDDVLLTDYYSFYLVSNSLKDYQFLDEGDPKFMVKRRSPDNVANYGIHPYTPIHMELFCLRMLLINFSARSFDDLLQYNGNIYTSFADVAQSRGLINNKREFFDCMDEAIKCNYPGFKIRWLFCNLIRSGANCSELYNEYHDVLMEDFENEKDLKVELVTMLNRMKVKRQQFFDDIVVLNSYPFAQKQELSSSLSENQNRVLSEIINFIDDTNCSNLCFLQGSAGTGKTFLIKTLINILEHNERKCLISATTGIAASQYKGASTVHSLFHLTIDQDKKNGRFTSNIEKNTFAEQLLQQADLIIIDECSMLTRKVIGDCDMTLRYAMVESSDEGIPVQTPDKMPPFGGKKILFVGDFLQLPPVDRTSAPVFQRMIYELPWWNDVLTFSLAEPMRCTEFYWFAFLRLLSLNHSYIKSLYWKDLPFIEVTTSLEYASYWYTSDLNITYENPYFPLDRIWICATNAAVDDMNCYFAEELIGKTQEFPPIVGLTEIINKDQYDTRVFPRPIKLIC